MLPLPLLLWLLVNRTSDGASQKVRPVNHDLPHWQTRHHHDCSSNNEEIMCTNLHFSCASCCMFIRLCLHPQSIGSTQQYVSVFIVTERIMTRIIRLWFGAQWKIKGSEKGWGTCLDSWTFSVTVVSSAPMLNHYCIYFYWCVFPPLIKGTTVCNSFTFLST